MMKLLWAAWLALMAALTWKPVLWHAEYLRRSAYFYWLFLFIFLFLPLTVTGYAWVRRRLEIWPWEPAAIAGALALAALVFEPRALLCIFWMGASCYGAGQWLAKRAGLNFAAGAERIALAGSLGVGLLAVALFFVGLAGFFFRWVFVATLALMSGLFRHEIAGLIDDFRCLGRRWAEHQELRGGLTAVVVLFGSMFGVFTAMVALAPSIAFDPLRMHLPLAAYYVEQHAFTPMPVLPYSYYPQSVELLMTAGWALSGQSGAQLVNPALFSLTLLLVFVIGRTCGLRPLAALTGAVFGASIPFLHWTGSVPKNDFALALFQLAAIQCYLRWRLAPSGSEEWHRFRWIQLGTVFVAFSFGVKHVALFGAVPIGLMFLHAAWKQPRRWRAMASLALLLVCLGSFWHVRTFLLKGNPIYPDGVRYVAGESAQARHHATTFMRLARYVYVPWYVHFNGLLAFESPLPNPLGVFLVLFLPVWWISSRVWPKTGERVCLFFIVIYYLLWCTVLTTLRYALAPLLLLALFTGARASTLWEWGAFWRRSTATAAVYSMIFAICGTTIIELQVPQLAYFAGRLDRAGYLRAGLTTYGSLEFLRRTAGHNGRVFGVDNCSAAYAPDPAQFDCMLTVLTPLTPAQIAGWFMHGSYDFLITPRDAFGARVEAEVAQRSPTVRLYEDQGFRVTEVNRASGAQ